MRYIPYEEEDEKKRFFIPKYFEFNPQVFDKNILVMKNISGEIVIYLKPIVRTILNDRTSTSKIKERINSNARLLIKKGLDKSRVTTIKGEQWLPVNCDFDKVTEEKFLVMNNKKWE